MLQMTIFYQIPSSGQYNYVKKNKKYMQFNHLLDTLYLVDWCGGHAKITYFQSNKSV